MYIAIASYIRLKLDHFIEDKDELALPLSVIYQTILVLFLCSLATNEVLLMSNAMRERAKILERNNNRA